MLHRECIPTGALTLDIALGGGFPKGRIIEVNICIISWPCPKDQCLEFTFYAMQIFGPESSGKSTLALHAIATVQKNGGTAALIDAEHAFDPMFSKVSPPTQTTDAIAVGNVCAGTMLGLPSDSPLPRVPRSRMEKGIGRWH